MSKTVWIQIALIVVTLLVAARLLIGSGQRTQAVRRLSLIVFAALAILSILIPKVWTKIAHAVGIGRGTDLILYALVVAFFSFVATAFKRQRENEQRYTQLARKMALAEAPPIPGTEADDARRPPAPPAF